MTETVDIDVDVLRGEPEPTTAWFRGPVAREPKRRTSRLEFPRTAAEAEAQVLLLRRAVDGIRHDLASPVEAGCAATGLPAEDYPLWRERAEHALGIKSDQLAERELWLQREFWLFEQTLRRLHVPSGPTGEASADGATLPDQADHTAQAAELLARSREVLRDWRGEFEDGEVPADEDALLAEVDEYLRRHPVQRSLPIGGR